MKLLTVSALLCALMALTSAIEANTEVEGLIPTVKSPLESSGCPSDWIKYNDRCFTYIPTAMSWAVAQRNCQFLEANLASVHDDAEYYWIQRLVAMNGKKQAWIGGTDAPQEMFWIWSDGSPFRYSKWCKGQPSNSPSEHCLRVNYSVDKCWDDARCAIRLPSVCAMNVGCPRTDTEA